MRRSALGLTLGCLAAVAVHAATISGVVVNPDGSPAEGARIWVWTHFPANATEREPVLTGVDGRFAIEREPDSAGRVSLFALRPDRVGGYYGEPADSLTVRLMPLGAKPLRVQDEAGRPLAGVCVEPDAFVPTWPDKERTDWARPPPGMDLPTGPLTTGADGTVNLPLPVGGATRVLVTAPRRVTRRTLIRDEGQPPEPVVMPPAGAIAGRVVDAEGRPMPDVPVVAEAHVSPPSYVDRLTDADGRFLLDGLPPTPHRVRCLPGGDNAPIFLPREAVPLTAGEITDLGDIKPSAGVPLKVRVVEAGTGAPVAGAKVIIQGSVWRLAGPTNAAGEATAEVAPGSNRLVLHAANVPAPYLPAQPNEKTFEAELGRAPGIVEFQVQRGVMIRGRLITREREPVAGEVLQLGSTVVRYTPRTLEDGTFEAGPLPADERLSVALGDPANPVLDRRLTVAGQIPLPPSGRELMLVVEPVPTAPLLGRVVDRDGRPLANVPVTLVAGRRGWPDDGWQNDPPRTTVTDATGQFKFEDIGLPWNLELSLADPRYRFISGGELPEERRLEPPLQVSDFVVEPRLTHAAGLVIDAAGRPAAGVTVFGLGQCPAEPVVTGADGRFALEPLSAATRVLIALRGELEYGRAERAAGEMTIRPGDVPGPHAMALVDRRLLAVELLERIDPQELSLDVLDRLARADLAAAAERIPQLSPQQHDQGVCLLLRTAAATEPQQALAMRELLGQIQDPGLQAWAAAELARGLLPIAAETARELARQSAEAGTQAKGRWRFAGYGAAAAIEQALGDPVSAGIRVDQALAELQEVDARGREWASVSLALALAAEPDLVEQILPALEPRDARQVAQWLTISRVCTRDPVAALALYDRWFGNGPITGQIVDPETGDRHSMGEYQEMVPILAEKLSVVDGAGALAFAERITQPALRVSALAAVMPALTGEQAERAATDMLTAENADLYAWGMSPWAIQPMIARSFIWGRPDVAQARFAAAERVNGDSPEARLQLGFHLAWLRPNRARMLIERAAALTGPALNGPARARRAVQALCALSAEDAVAMAEWLDADDRALLDVVDWLLLDDRARDARPPGKWQPMGHEPIY